MCRRCLYGKAYRGSRAEGKGSRARYHRVLDMEDKDVELLEKLHNEGIRIAAFCTGFISLVEEGEREKYIESLKKTIAVSYTHLTLPTILRV